VGDYKQEKELILRHDLKDSADDFIQGAKDRIDISNHTNVSQQSEYLKKQFIKRKNNIGEYLPRQKDDSKDKFEKLGSFKSDVGEISVGYKKFNPKTNLRFTLISNKEKDFDDKNSKFDFKDSRNYFKRNFENNESKYKENNTTLEFDSKNKTIRKAHELFGDEIDNDEDEILYDDELENRQLESLKKTKSIDPVSISSAISDLKEIKNEKKDDNEKLKKDIEEFSRLYLSGKLKKIEDSDQLEVAMQRLSSESLYIILKKRMEEIRNLRKRLCMVLSSILADKLKRKELNGFLH